MNVSWSHCVLRVNDLDAMILFYCETLGFRVADRGMIGPEQEIAFLSGSSSDHHQLGLMTGRGGGDRGSLDHNAFRVESVADVQTMVARIEADDRIGPGFPVTHGNAVSVYFRDPEDNGIEVFCDTPWHVRQPQVKGWDTTASPDEVLAAVERDFRDEPEFTSMADYRAMQAEAFGE